MLSLRKGSRLCFIFSLHVILVYVGDSMAFHNGLMFSTLDADHDNRTEFSCAQVYHGAWWYNYCHHSNLNGLYLRGNHTSNTDGISWGAFRGKQYSLKVTEMKIAPRN